MVMKNEKLLEFIVLNDSAISVIPRGVVGFAFHTLHKIVDHLTKRGICLL